MSDRRLSHRLYYPCNYLHEDHGRDLLGGEGLGLAEVVDLDRRVSAVVDNLERPRLDILLDSGVIKTAADETPCMVRTGPLDHVIQLT